jgi:hypothetical protein
MFKQPPAAMNLARSLPVKARQTFYDIRDSVRKRDSINISEAARNKTLDTYLTNHSTLATLNSKQMKVAFSKEVHGLNTFLHLCIISDVTLTWEELMALKACFFWDYEQVYHILPSAAVYEQQQKITHLWHQIELAKEGADKGSTNAVTFELDSKATLTKADVVEDCSPTENIEA